MRFHVSLSKLEFINIENVIFSKGTLESGLLVLFLSRARLAKTVSAKAKVEIDSSKFSVDVVLLN